MNIIPRAQPAPSNQEKLMKLYEYWLCNYVNVERFAEYLEVSEHRARVIINHGRALRNDTFGHH